MDPKMKWNRKYNERISQLREPEPNPRLINLVPYFSGGNALDLACGLGGNSLFLARHNYQVQAIDISEVAINYLHDQAIRQKLAIETKVGDLTKNHLMLHNSRSFDLIVISYYLDRSLFPLIKNLIKKNGFFFMETFSRSSQSLNNRISDQYKLESGELLMEFANWKVLYFEENTHEGRQTIFCQWSLDT
jgi:tellurite methyltransferase